MPGPPLRAAAVEAVTTRTPPARDAWDALSRTGRRRTHSRWYLVRFVQRRCATSAQNSVLGNGVVVGPSLHAAQWTRPASILANAMQRQLVQQCCADRGYETRWRHVGCAMMNHVMHRDACCAPETSCQTRPRSVLPKPRGPSPDWLEISSTPARGRGRNRDHAIIPLGHRLSPASCITPARLYITLMSAFSIPTSLPHTQNNGLLHQLRDPPAPRGVSRLAAEPGAC